MHLLRDARFVEESEKFNLRYCCEDCGLFDAREERCAHEWPTELHRIARYRDGAPSEIVFCKEFELA